jgi:SanA protein
MLKPYTRLLRQFGQHRKIIALSLVLAAGLMFCGALILANTLCQASARGKVYHSTALVPANDVGLVLGTARFTKRGYPNLHFERRITAAAELFHSGKVRHLLVSGDNHVEGYDEATDMMNALVEAGVPAQHITRDYAGFRTLDSIVRAKKVFGLERCTIITENFHCPRALWIAGVHKVDAIAFAAPDLRSLRWSARVRAREVLARALCGLDLYVWNRQPKFYGPLETIHVAASQDASPLATASTPGGIDQ